MRLSIFIPLNYRHLLFVGTLGPIFVPEIKLLVGNGDRFECVNYSIIEIQAVVYGHRHACLNSFVISIPSMTYRHF